MVVLAHSLSLTCWVELNALFGKSNLEIIACSDDAIDLIKFAVLGNREVWKESLELLLRLNYLNLMIGAEQCPEIMLSVLRKGWVWLELWVTVVSLIVAGHSLAS